MTASPRYPACKCFEDVKVGSVKVERLAVRLTQYIGDALRGSDGKNLWAPCAAATPFTMGAILANFAFSEIMNEEPEDTNPMDPEILGRVAAYISDVHAYALERVKGARGVVSPTGEVHKRPYQQ